MRDMMTKLFTLVASLGMVLTACGSRPAGEAVKTDEQTTSASVIPTFNADSAYAFVKKQCDMGPRVPGTPAHKQCVEWITACLSQWCDTVVTQTAPVETFDHTRLTMTNLVGVINPQAEQRILLLAHYDCRPWADNDPDASRQREPVMGANDAASGVGVLVELARVLSKDKPQVGVDLLFVDVEDWGEEGDDDSWALGTQYWARNPHVKEYNPSFGILLDMVGAHGAVFSPEMFSWQYAQSVVSLVWKTAAQAGYSNYFVMRDEAAAVTDDHVPINKAGIPCIDIIDTREQGGFFDGWHTTHDTFDVIDPATLKAVGQTLTQLIYSY